ncbi:hypothetical protein LCGC14_1071710 [marine sediment metagenome]|uniref:HTH cro/C1-type domain-containing protein n=1 Tax=marine sediment metagenome TaxID=412755 RepID=A0A0F9Q148_9ZZZZ
MKVTIKKPKNNIPEYAVVLRQARKNKGMTLKQVADKIGISFMGMSHYELGRREPRLKYFEKWLDVFGMELVIGFKKKKHGK